MTVLNESTHTGSYILSEANGSLSREIVMIVTGQKLAAGTVLGKFTASPLWAQYDPAASDGTEVAAGILYGAVDATDTDKEGVAHVRETEVITAELVWKAGTTDVQKTAALEALAEKNIIAR